MSRIVSRHASRVTAHTSRVRGPLVAAATFLVAAAAVACAVRPGAGTDADGPAEQQQQSVSIAGEPNRAAAGQRTGAVTPQSPTSVRLPSGTTVPVRPVSTTSDGILDVPSDVNFSGWWRGGSRIGDPFGSNLLAAHVDSTTQGLGPYAELLSIEAGQPIVLTSANLRQEYVVSSLRLLPKGPLTEHRWIYSASGPHRLTMVTCAGPFIPSKGGYQKLAVVVATVVGEPTQRGS